MMSKPSSEQWLRPTGASLRCAVLVLLCAGGCCATQDASPPASKPAPSGPVAEVLAPEPPKPPSQPRPSASRIKNISIEPQPLCSPDADRAAGDRAKNRWLAPDAIQRDVYLLDAALKPFAAELIGTTADHANQSLVAVFHTTFRDYEAVQKSLLEKIGSLHVVLRPACHSREESAAAEAVLSRRDFHPKAASVALSYGLDASFSGFDVMVQESAPEVADALKQRLGPLVRVELGSLHRL